MLSLELFSIYWILASCAVLFAAFVRGVAGFGLALILAPILLMILSPKSVVVVNLILSMVSNIIAYKMTREIVRNEGIFVGMSSGAAMYATLEIVRNIENVTIIVIFPDGGEKYLSTNLFKR